jgi:hypothetical protein
VRSCTAWTRIALCQRAEQAPNGALSSGGGDVESSRQRGRLLAATLALVFSLLAPAALAQHPIPENERWATITHPGNASDIIPPVSPEPDYSYDPRRVDYEYQISRTEVTGKEWFEFVLAYAQYDLTQIPLTPRGAGYNRPDQGVSRWRGRSIPTISRDQRSSR